MATKHLCCRSGGSNLNPGTKSGNTTVPGTSPDYSSANGNWDGTSVFTPTDGSTPASTINAGDLVTVHLDAATVAVYIAEVVSVAGGVNGAITLSTTIKAGTPPASGATGRSLICGGAMKGPNGSEDFPFDLATLHTLAGTGNELQVNMMNDGIYSITASITPSTAVLGVHIRGFTSAYDDGGYCQIQGPTTGASFTLFNSVSNAFWNLSDIEFRYNGNSGSATAINGVNIMYRCAVRNMHFTGTTAVRNAIECWFDGNGQGNGSNNANVNGSGDQPGWFYRCIFSRCTGSNGAGYNQTGGSTAYLHFVDCIFAGNRAGLRWSAGFQAYFTNCDFYDNALSGVIITDAACQFTFQGCNFFKNGAYGIETATGCTTQLSMMNCAFGAGTEGNTSGAYGGAGTQVLQHVESEVSFTSNANPWNDPANGDFTVTHADAKAAGARGFFQPDASYDGTISYRDRGAGQHQELSYPPVFIRKSKVLSKM